MPALGRTDGRPGAQAPTATGRRPGARGYNPLYRRRGPQRAPCQERIGPTNVYPSCAPGAVPRPGLSAARTTDNRLLVSPPIELRKYHKVKFDERSILRRLPEDWADALAHTGLSVPPHKTQIALRVDDDVLEWFKAQGVGYQTRMNAVLRAFRDAHVRSTGAQQ